MSTIKCKQEPCIAVCGALCLMITKVVIGWIKNQNPKLKTLLKLPDITSTIGLKNIRKEKKTFWHTKLISWKITKLEKEIKLQKQHDQKEYLTHSIKDIGLLKSASEVEGFCGSKRKESDKKEILKNQILFRKHVLDQKSSSKKHFQMGESVGNKYKPFDVQQLKVNLIQIILFSSGTPEERATELVQNSIKDIEIRRQKLETKKVK